MQRVLLFLFIVFASPAAYKAAGGLVDLDEFTFDKITGKFDASLVKFDVAYPYGDKHEAFNALAKEAKDVGELLVADVGVKDYGEKDNDALASRYGANKENFPVVKLFVKGKSEPIPFDDKKGFTTDNLRRFVKENTGLSISMPGCVASLDQLAVKYMKTHDKSKRQVILEEDLPDALKKLTTKDTFSGKIYTIIMEKVLQKGDDFIRFEQERIKKLLGGKLTEEKKRELQTRSNILLSFDVIRPASPKKEL